MLIAGEQVVQGVAEVVPLAVLGAHDVERRIGRQALDQRLCAEAGLAGIAGQSAQRDEEGLDVHTLGVLQANEHALKNLFGTHLGTDERVFFAARPDGIHERCGRGVRGGWRLDRFPNMLISVLVCDYLSGQCDRSPSQPAPEHEVRRVPTWAMRMPQAWPMLASD